MRQENLPAIFTRTHRGTSTTMYNILLFPRAGQGLQTLRDPTLPM